MVDMSGSKIILAAILIEVIFAGWVVAASLQDADSDSETLLIYSGAGLKTAMDELGDEFESETGIAVDIIYGGSGHIFGQLATSKRGDLFIPGAKYYTSKGIEEGLLEESRTRNVTYHVPVIIVKKGNPNNITSLEDLKKPGVKVALGSDKECAIGRLSKKLLTKEGLYEGIESSTLEVTTATVNELLLYVTIGTVDAAIVWEDNVGTLVRKDEVEVIEIAHLKNIINTVPISVTRCSNSPELAEDFIDFACGENGHDIWIKNGFEPYEYE
ncbi:MAG: molybdate ABC transporter substrate-binding protein [Halobacteriota archaeon]|nr:molybdate ABC transporter substrate-binding protein [Halobacteriota archaeon]